MTFRNCYPNAPDAKPSQRATTFFTATCSSVLRRVTPLECCTADFGASLRRRRLHHRSQHASNSCRPRSLLRSSAQIIPGCFHALLLFRFSAQIQIATGSCFRHDSRAADYAPCSLCSSRFTRPGRCASKAHRMLLYNWARRTASTHAIHGHAILAYSVHAAFCEPILLPGTASRPGTTRNSFGTQWHFELANTTNLLLDSALGQPLCLTFERNMVTHAQFIRHSMARGATRLISQTP